MKIASTRAFRAHLNHYLSCAEDETVFVTRPGDGLLMITPVPKRDVELIIKGYGKEPDKFIIEKNTKTNSVKKGRPNGSKISDKQFLKKYPNVVKKLQKGMAIRDVAELCGVSMATVQKVKKVSNQG